jgi:hypothetical protein
MSVIQVYNRNDIGNWVADLEKTIIDSGASGAATVEYVTFETPDQIRVYTDIQMSAGEITAVGTEITNWVVPVLSEEDSISHWAVRVINMSLRDASSSFKEINSSSWQEVTSFLYNGTNSVGPIKMVCANLWNSNNGKTSNLRVVDETTGNVIASLNATTTDTTNIGITSTISNLPTTTTKCSVQIKDQGGKARCSNVTIYI